jgi:hypothetical protein
VGASSKPLAGAPEFTRERVALRCIQEVSSVIAAGGDAADTAGVLRVDGAQSCQNVLFQLMREVRASYASNFVRYRTNFVECLHICFCSMFWNWKHFIHGIVQAAVVVTFDCSVGRTSVVDSLGWSMEYDLELDCWYWAIGVWYKSGQEYRMSGCKHMGLNF